MISVRSARGGLRNRPNSSTTLAAGLAAAAFSAFAGRRCRCRHGRSGAYLSRRLAAVDEVEHAHDLVRRQAAKQRQADVAVAFECAQHQGDDEHLLVIAHVAMVVVPRREPHVEPRVELDQVAVNRVDLHRACGAASSAAC